MVSEVKVLVVTPEEAREMRDAIVALEQQEAQTAQAQRQVDIATATAWFNTLGINIQGAQNRGDALNNFDQIKSRLDTETDNFRLIILREKLTEANEKFKKRKRNG